VNDSNNNSDGEIIDRPESDKQASTKFETNLVTGSVVKQLMLFAIPFIISNFVQSLYSVADMIIVGHFAGVTSMSGVNTGGQVSFLMTNVIFGLCSGATVLIGQYLGNNDRVKLKQTVSTLFTLLIIAAVVLSSLMLVFKDGILGLMNTPDETYKEASSYLLITTLGTVFIFGYNAFSSVMRGMGDSKRPLVFVTIACITNVILDIIAVGPLKMGAAGAALATIISQALSMILCIMYFIKNDFVFDFKFKSFRMHGERLRMLLKIGIPTSVQNVVSSISFLFLTSVVNLIGGEVANAAVGSVGKFNAFAILPAIAISSSVSAMCAQNIGAGQFERARKTMKTGIVVALSISVVMFAIAMFFSKQIMLIFGAEEEFIKQGKAYLFAWSFDYLLAPIMFQFNGLFIGSGHTIFSLITNMISAVLARIPVAYICGVTLGWGIIGVGCAGPAATVVSLAICVGFYFSRRWMKSTVISVAADMQ
jgi:putative MATE family efflux protein